MPLMRITKDMVDTMGGKGDPNYTKFCNMSFEMFLILRANAQVFFEVDPILSFSSLTIDSHPRELSFI